MAEDRGKCAHCDQPFYRTDWIRIVRTPEGEKRLHESCLQGKAPPLRAVPDPEEDSD